MNLTFDCRAKRNGKTSVAAPMGVAGRQTNIQTCTQTDTHTDTHSQTHAIHLCASFLAFVRVFNRRKSATEGIEETKRGRLQEGREGQE